MKDARELALKLAVDVTPGRNTDHIVQAAEKFLAFLDPGDDARMKTMRVQ